MSAACLRASLLGLTASSAASIIISLSAPSRRERVRSCNKFFFSTIIFYFVHINNFTMSSPRMLFNFRRLRSRRFTLPTVINFFFFFNNFFSCYYFRRTREKKLFSQNHNFIGKQFVFTPGHRGLSSPIRCDCVPLNWANHTISDRRASIVCRASTGNAGNGTRGFVCVRNVVHT